MFILRIVGNGFDFLEKLTCKITKYVRMDDNKYHNKIGFHLM